MSNPSEINKFAYKLNNSNKLIAFIKLKINIITYSIVFN